MENNHSNKYFVSDKINFGKRLFTLITSLMMTTFTKTRALFVDLNMSRIADNNIAYHKWTMFVLLLYWILIHRQSNTNKTPQTVWSLLQKGNVKKRGWNWNCSSIFVLNWMHFVAPCLRKRVYKQSLPW